MGLKFSLGLLVSSLAVVAAGQGQAEQSAHVLVWYDFDGSEIETGPYTLSVFEDAQGSVSLSSTYPFSGHRSVEIQAVAGDGEFAELQGFFSDKHKGQLFIHFALMVAEPQEAMNIALAGISHFRMVKDGIGFWLKTEDGVLHHVSAGQDEALFRVEAFVWYVFDVTYDIDRGTYDLNILEEGRDDPIVALVDQPNAVGIPGSKLRKFSFIGDPPGLDRSNVRFYVDDVIVTADGPIYQASFVAPGRRMLFVDIYDYWQSRLYEEPRCLPALGHEDFGLSSTDLHTLAELGQLQLFDERADRLGEIHRLPKDLPEYLRRSLEGMELWRRGCAAPSDCDAEELCASEIFERAGTLVPEAKLYPMSTVLALGAEKRWEEADSVFLSIYPEWQDDPRFPGISAILGIGRGDLNDAEQWLKTAIESLPRYLEDPLIRRLWWGRVDQELVRELKSSYPADWPDYVETALTAEHKYYVLLWQRRYQDALRYAGDMAELLRKMHLSPSRWIEREGDAAFYNDEHLSALQFYQQSLEGRKKPDPILLKLSDVHFRLGNLEEERDFREKIYGRLDSQ